MYSLTIEQAMYETSENLWNKLSQMWKRNKNSFTEYLEVVLQGLCGMNNSFYLPADAYKKN